jgi:hypothetical protein
MPNRTVAALAFVSFVLACSMSAAQPVAPSSARADIARALSAAPASVAAGAAVVRMDDHGKTTELRPGRNGWTCMPEDPGTPVPYPVCLDRNGFQWFEAAMAGRAPDPDKVGYSYMLRGGTAWSATDPAATSLPKGETKYLTLPPHIMILSARLAATSGFPSGESQPDPGKPFVIYGATPFAIIIMPVK